MCLWLHDSCRFNCCNMYIIFSYEFKLIQAQIALFSDQLRKPGKKTCSTLHKKKHISPGLRLAIQIFVKIGRLNFVLWQILSIKTPRNRPLYRGVSKNNGFSPQIHPLKNQGFPILFTIHFGVQYPYFCWKHHVLGSPYLSPCHPTATNGVRLFRSLRPEEVKGLSCRARGYPGVTCLTKPLKPMPIGSMYGIFTYIYHINQPNVYR